MLLALLISLGSVPVPAASLTPGLLHSLARAAVSSPEPLPMDQFIYHIAQISTELFQQLAAEHPAERRELEGIFAPLQEVVRLIRSAGGRDVPADPVRHVVRGTVDNIRRFEDAHAPDDETQIKEAHAAIAQYAFLSHVRSSLAALAQTQAFFVQTEQPAGSRIVLFQLLRDLGDAMRDFLRDNTLDKHLLQKLETWQKQLMQLITRPILKPPHGQQAVIQTLQKEILALAAHLQPALERAGLHAVESRISAEQVAEMMARKPQQFRADLVAIIEDYEGQREQLLQQIAEHRDVLELEQLARESMRQEFARIMVERQKTLAENRDLEASMLQLRSQLSQLKDDVGTKGLERCQATLNAKQGRDW
jgi:hypothetical protein